MFRTGLGLHNLKPIKALCTAWALILLSSLSLKDTVIDLLLLKDTHSISLCAYIAYLH